MSVASLVGGKVAMGTLSRVVYCLLLQTAYDWPKALNARLRKKYENNLKAWDGKLKKNREKKYKAEGKKIQGKGNCCSATRLPACSPGASLAFWATQVGYVVHPG
jgi:hypothetical protein